MILKFLISSLLFFQSSIYDYNISLANGTSLKLSDHHGKKMLFVNIATGSEFHSQLQELQQLQNQYKDDLVVIAIPSNSFGNETLSDQQILDFVNTHYQWNIPVAMKVSVTGADISPIYQWLTYISENGMMESSVKSDFQKFLVEENGKLVAVFSGQVSPLATELTEAIKSNYAY